MLNHEILTGFAILKHRGGMSIFAHFGHFRPTLHHWGTLWALPRGLLMLFSCSTPLTPSLNFWQARFDDSIENLEHLNVLQSKNLGTFPGRLRR